ncbi:MAG: phage major capsid protein, partial [Dehalococcoidales bacterium]|nr:phage major capsid protein [Dehalococcoidales bacterium]
KPVIFSDAADVPIVGDFRYYHLNYDGQPIYDSDKNVDKGEYIWVLTAWFDQKFKLYSAFRLAEVVTASE